MTRHKRTIIKYRSQNTPIMLTSIWRRKNDIFVFAACNHLFESSSSSSIVHEYCLQRLAASQILKENFFKARPKPRLSWQQFSHERWLSAGSEKINYKKKRILRIAEYILEYIYRNNSLHIDDFRPYIIEYMLWRICLCATFVPK